MAASSSGALKDLVHPSINEALKTHNSVTFKLVKTGERTFVSRLARARAENTSRREHLTAPRDNCATKIFSLSSLQFSLIVVQH
jgi:hypothetical protein